MLGNTRQSLRQWGYSWVALVIAFAIHVLDEALTGFLPLYNRIITELRTSYGFLPLPTFTFAAWLAVLFTALAVLGLLSPLVFAGRKPLRYLSYVFSVVMILNGAGHIGASIYWGVFAPGVFSSPLLLLTAAALLISTIKARQPTDVGA